MDFIISGEELGALYGLPHAQQLLYFRGIRPYMNVKTGLVGIERGISYQSLAEQLYIEPHQGIKSGNTSRAQARRAIASLERAGLILVQSDDYQLILKCVLAPLDYYVRKKAITKASQLGVMAGPTKCRETTRPLAQQSVKASTSNTLKAVTPHKEDNNYIYLLSAFEKFWTVYPNKKSQPQAWKVFQELNPDNALLTHMLSALDAQIKNRNDLEFAKAWVPPWKNPANWLSQHCWKDELTPITKPESNHAKPATSLTKKSAFDVFADSLSDCQFEFDDDE